MTEHIPGTNDAEKFFKLVDFWIRNYNVPNIEAYRKQLKEELDPVNQKIIIAVRKVLGEKDGRAS
jgi:uncharacterized protein YlaN (UPF0358 family)